MKQFLGLVISLVAIAAAPVTAAPSAERLQLCASCHGVNGNSTIPENPKLAGLQARYASQQMKDFKSGKRASAVMAGIMAGIDDAEIELLATYFHEQKPAPSMPPKPADPKLLAQGKEIYFEGIVGSAVPACAGCHTETGKGTNRYPRLAGQHGVYLVQQMLAYKSSERKNDDRELMRAVATRMTEAEIRAVSEFIQTLKGEDE
jgi:cytochrome c553